MPEFLDGPSFATRKLRTSNLALLYRQIAKLTPAFTTLELVAKCHAAQIPAQAVRDLSEVLEDPHLAATSFFERRHHESEGTFVEMQPPVRFSEPPRRSGRTAPRLNEHGDMIRSEGSVRSK